MRPHWEQVEAYLEQLKERHYAHDTIAAARLWLGRFQLFCQERAGVPDLAGATAEHAQAFHDSLRWELGPQGKLYSAHTVMGAVGYVRSFFRWAVQRGSLLVDPFQEIEGHAVHSERRRLTEAEVERLMRAPDTLTPQGLRDRALLETLYGTGIRRSECHWLDVDDFDPGQFVLMVRRGKGGVPRRQPVGPHLVEILRRYLAEARPCLVRSPCERALFVGDRGMRLHKNTIGTAVGKNARLVELGNVTPHLLRHAYASHLIAHHADLTDVQRLLGHRSVGSTGIYAHVHPDQVAQEHRRTHPRACRKKP